MWRKSILTTTNALHEYRDERIKHEKEVVKNSHVFRSNYNKMIKHGLNYYQKFIFRITDKIIKNMQRLKIIVIKH